MEVYIEYVIIDNLIIDIIILLITAKLLRLKLKKSLIFISALLGCIFAVLMPLITINFYLLTLLKLVVGLMMIIIVKKYSSIKEIIATFLVFITVTFMLGGVCYAIMALLAIKSHPQNIVIFGYATPVSLYLVIICLFMFVFLKILRFVQHKTSMSNYIYTIKITVNNKQFHLKAFLDTGNQLFDENNHPVLVLSQDYYRKIAKTTNLKPINSFMVNSVTNSSNLIVFQLDSLEILCKNIKTKHTKCAVSNHSFKDYDCLLNQAIFFIN